MLARQTHTPLPASVSTRAKITATTRLTRSITKAMNDPSQPPATTTITPTVASSNTSTMTPTTFQSASDLNIHSIPNLPDWLKDIYARLDSQATQISEMQALIQENQSLRSSLKQTTHQLEQAHQRIQELESQKASPVHAPVTPASATATPPSFAELTKKPADPFTSKKPKSKAQPCKKYQPLSLDINDTGLAAARHFSAVPKTHGYRFVYIPNRGQSAISTKREDLHAMNIQNKRVLDIHFRDRHVCGLLIHHDYYETLKAQLTKYNLKFLDFNPLDPKILRDPKYLD